MDDAVDGTKEGQQDEIGIARVRLRDLLAAPMYSEQVEVKDELGNINGRVLVEIEVRDLDAKTGLPTHSSIDLKVGKEIE